MLLKDKTAVITGANSGIGKAIALAFLNEGANVIAIARNTEKLKSLKTEAQHEEKLSFYSCDVSDINQVKKTSEMILKDYEKIDILINNAGITQDNLLIRMTEEQWDSVININLKGTFLLTQALIPSMVKNRSGVILNTSSVVGLYGNAGQTNYVASKAGIIGMTKTWAKEYGKRGIRCNAIAPGYIMTEMTDKLSDAVKDKIKENIPLQRLGTTDDIANAFIFLASDQASYITGQVLEVSGGLVF